MAESGSPVDSSPETKEEKKSSFTVDIKEICSNMKYRLQFQAMDRIGGVDQIENLKETPYLTDAWFDHNKIIMQYAWFGEKQGKRRPIREFVTHALAIKTMQDRAKEKAEIEQVKADHSERPIECYNMRAVIAYMAAAAGVTIPPRELVRFLRVHKIRRAGKAYQNARQSDYLKKLGYKIKDLNKAVDKYESYVKDRVKYFVDHPEMSAPLVPEGRESLESLMFTNIKRKLYSRPFVDRLARNELRKKIDDVGLSYCDFKVAVKEADACLFEFLMKYIPNLCKLNPVRKGEKPKLFHY